MRALRHPRRLVSRFRTLRFETLELRSLLTTGIGVYDPADDSFSLRNQASAGTPDGGEFQFVAPGATPVVGDWNGDGQDDFGVFDSSTATWSLRYGAETGEANAGVFQFGSPGSTPVVGDWNGDGRDDLGVFNAGQWRLRFGASPGLANAGVFNFGSSAHQPVVGDWDGDGVDGIGLFDSATANWSLRQTASDTGAAAGSFTFGAAGGFAITGDWNGDGVDGIGVYQSATSTWSLRQTPSAGAADAGVFVFGTSGLTPVTGDWDGPAPLVGELATIVLPPVNLDLLGLEVRTSPITVAISPEEGDGKLLGNLLATVSGLIDLEGASDALNVVLDSTVDLLNSADLKIAGLLDGPLADAPESAAQVLELFVAPVHLDLLGVDVTTSTVRVTITTRSGDGLVLGNAVTELINLFNPPLPEKLSVSFLNQKLDELLEKLNEHLPGIAPAPVPAVPIADGQILNVTVPPLDLNLLGLVLETSPITVNASAQVGDGALLGNVLTTALKTLDATPQNLSELNTNINGILAKVVGVLNAADLSLASGAVEALPDLIESLVSPTLTAPAEGATAPILDLLIATQDGDAPPVKVDLLGLTVTTSNIEAHLSAQTGDGQVLGNLLYNLANLADPGGPAGLLNLVNLLGAGSLDDAIDVVGGAVTPDITAPEELLTLTLKPLNIGLLGLEVHTDPIVVTLSTQAGDGKLLGNLLDGITTLINVDAVGDALNNVLSATVDLLNSASLLVDGVGSGTFDDADVAVTPVLDLFVAPVHLDLLGLVATTAPVHLTITSRSGPGLVLGNVVSALANAFNPPLPSELDIDFINERLEDLIVALEDQIPGIDPAPIPPVELTPDQFLELTVPPLDLDLLGLLVQTSPITVNAAAQTGDGLLLGNVLTTVLNTVDATTENLTGLSNNLNALLAKVVGVLNAAHLVLPSNPLDLLPTILQTLTSPTLIATEDGATTPILDLIIASDNAGPPVDVDLLGLEITTSNIEAQVLGQTGEGKLLGNLLYNVANLLNPGGGTPLLSLLSQLSDLAQPTVPELALGGVVSFRENAVPLLLAPAGAIFDSDSLDFAGGRLTVAIAANATANDLLRINKQGDGPGQINIHGTRVIYEGVTIGTFSGGVGSTALIVNLNVNATLEAVTALVRNINFRTLTEAPSTLPRTLTWQLTDGDGGVSDLVTQTVTVTAVNDAPLLNNAGNPTLAPIDEDAANPPGTLVKNLVAGAISDVDPDSLKGIAVMDAPAANGTWQFSLDNGSTWQPMGTPTVRSAVLLPADDLTRVRFIPSPDFSGVVQIVYRAWDRTQGAAGGLIDPVGHTGGENSLSRAVESASQVVRAVNDRPVLILGGTRNYVRNASAFVLSPAAIVQDVDSPNFDAGQLRVRITTGAHSSNRLALGSGFTVDAENNVKFGSLTIGRRTSSGVGLADLVIDLNANATPALTQSLVRAIRFGTVGGPLGLRNLLFSLTDGDGGLSDIRSVRVNVIE